MCVGYVYMIESVTEDVRYYGSTAQPLSKRMADHRGDYRRMLKNNEKPSTVCHLVLKHPDARMLLVERVTYTEKTELFAREAHYIRSNECVNRGMKKGLMTPATVKKYAMLDALFAEKNYSYRELNMNFGFSNYIISQYNKQRTKVE
jgi:hypothetical protein